MPWKPWTRERLSAPDLQDYLQDQTVLHFASASAADAALPQSARKPGMVRWLDNVQRAEWWDPDGAGSWRYAFGTVPSVAISLGGGVANQPGFDPARVSIDPAGLVSASGTLSVVAFGANAALGVVPVGFRPMEPTERTVFGGDGRTPQRLSIGTDGTMTLRPTQAWGATYWTFDAQWITTP